MDPISIVVTALALGASAGLKETAAQAVRDGYAGLKALIQRKYAGINLGMLEANPESKARRAVVEEDLQKADAGQDKELLRSAQSLLDTVRSHTPEASRVIGVSLEDIKAASLELSDILARGAGGVVGVEVRRADVTGDIKISHVQADTASDKAPAVTAAPATRQKITILFLAANPSNTPPLKLDEECRAIDQALRLGEFRDSFTIQQQWAVRIQDLQEHLLRHRPDIVHFSSHGGVGGEIILEDHTGNTRPVSPEALGRLFSALQDDIRCIVLNACYSERQASTLAQHVDCVVGMSTAIGDRAAISFATAFYRALGYGRSVKTAFDLGCAEISLEALGEEDTPKLLAVRCDPSQVALGAPGGAPPKA